MNIDDLMMQIEKDLSNNDKDYYEPTDEEMREIEMCYPQPHYKCTQCDKMFYTVADKIETGLICPYCNQVAKLAGIYKPTSDYSIGITRSQLIGDVTHDVLKEL